MGWVKETDARLQRPAWLGTPYDQVFAGEYFDPPVSTGTASATISLTGAATAAVIATASGAGSIALTGAATASVAVTAGLSGFVDLGGVASGLAGSASGLAGAILLEGSAYGAVLVLALAECIIALTGTAIGDVALAGIKGPSARPGQQTALVGVASKSTIKSNASMTGIRRL